MALIKKEVTERYTYKTKEEQEQHKKEMERKGYKCINQYNESMYKSNWDVVCVIGAVYQKK